MCSHSLSSGKHGRPCLPPCINYLGTFGQNEPYVICPAICLSNGVRNTIPWLFVPFELTIWQQGQARTPIVFGQTIVEAIFLLTHNVNEITSRRSLSLVMINLRLSWFQGARTPEPGGWRMSCTKRSLETHTMSPWGDVYLRETSHSAWTQGLRET